MNDPVIFLLMVFLIVIGPLSAVWAVNTLFALSIEYTFQTWLAAPILCSALSGSKKK